MSKIYKDTKYYDLELVKKLIEEGLYDEFGNKLTNWVSFKDRDERYVYVPCTENVFHSYRNELRNEERREYAARRLSPVSIDQLYEDNEFEFADPNYEENDERLSRDELEAYVWELVGQYPKDDQQLLILFNQGLKDIEIAKILNKARSTVQEKRIKLLKELKEKTAKFQK
jgi:DNA-directed RNA polymerase specialized sigma24 family protein